MGAAVPLSGGGAAGPHLAQYGLGGDLPPYKWDFDPSSRLATIDMGRKMGGEGDVPLLTGSPSNTSPGPRLTSVPSGVLIQPFGHNRHGPKIGGYAPLRGAGSPSNTMLPGPTSTCLPRGTLIHPAI